MEDVSTVAQKVKNIQKAEEKLITKKANEKDKDQYLGKPSEAVIENIQTEDLDENIFIRFIITLPTQEIGYIDFTSHMVEKNKLDIFLDNIDCTVNDISDGFYKKIPVTYTNYHGWKAFYSKNKSELTIYKGESKWRTFDDDMALPRPDKKLASLYHIIPWFISFGYLYNFKVFAIDELILVGLMMTFVIWIFIWYMDAFFCGMTCPQDVRIKPKND